MKKTKSESKRQAELKKLKTMRDEEINLDDIPEVRDWDEAVRGKFYRPVKKAISLRVDADVLAWFKSLGPRYQSRINSVLREYMRRHRHNT